MRWLPHSTRIAALLLSSGLAACAADALPPRHLVLISVDTLRADHLGAYGNPLPLTPHLDRLAGRSTRFSAAYAPAPFTLPSVASMMTGRYPRQMGLKSNLGKLPAGVRTLADRFRAGGFKTAAIVSSFVLRETSGLDQGFDHFDAHFPQREVRRGAPERIATSTTDAAIEFLNTLPERESPPIFLWVHYQDPHGPYTAPGERREHYLEHEAAAPDGRRILSITNDGVGGLPGYQFLPYARDAAFYRAGYKGEVNYTDEEVGRLLGALAERGLLEEAAVIFVADHGEGLGEQDYWFAHGEYVNEPAVRIPLLLRVPGRRAGTRADLATLVDLVPTIVALFGLEADAADSGRDLLAPGAEDQGESVYFSTSRSASSAPEEGLVKDGYKYVRPLGEDAAARLFRLPDEERDLVESEGAVAQALQRELDAHPGHLGTAVAAEAQTPTDEERAALRSLGYVE